MKHVVTQDVKRTTTTEGGKPEVVRLSVGDEVGGDLAIELEQLGFAKPGKAPAPAKKVGKSAKPGPAASASEGE